MEKRLITDCYYSVPGIVYKQSRLVTERAVKFVVLHWEHCTSVGVFNWMFFSKVVSYISMPYGNIRKNTKV